VQVNRFLFEENTVVHCQNIQAVPLLRLLPAEEFLSLGGFFFISIRYQKGVDKGDCPTYFCNTRPIQNYPLNKVKEAQNAYISW
jgi:hypothetical protein